METLVDQAMREGAIGLSSGLMYTPNRYASTEELIALAKIASRYGGLYITHIRNEGDGLVDGLAEAVRIGREAGIPVEVLHFKRVGIRLIGGSERPTIRDAADFIEKSQREGVRIYADVYPYAASQTTLNVALPEWAQDGGREQMLARLRDPATRSRIRDELRKDLSSGIAGRTADTTMFGHTAHEPHRKFQGQTIDQVAAEMGVEPAEALLELIDKADGSTRAIYFGMREADVRFALTRPWTTIGSDGTAIAPDGILARAHPHPRWYGTFPRVLGRYVRQEKAMPLVEAVRKMTSLPASRLGLDDRGTLAVGEKADIVLFDPETIIDRSDFANPHQLSVGVQWLLVNGTVVLANGHHTNAKPGRVLRNRVRVGASGGPAHGECIQTGELPPFGAAARRYRWRPVGPSNLRDGADERDAVIE